MCGFSLFHTVSTPVLGMRRPWLNTSYWGVYSNLGGGLVLAACVLLLKQLPVELHDFECVR